MTQRLLATIKAHWVAFDGWAVTVLAGGDPLRLPLDRYLNLIYHWLTDGADREEIAKFDKRLWMPPKGVAAPKGSPWSAEAETGAFRAFVAQVKGVVKPASGGATPTGRE